MELTKGEKRVRTDFNVTNNGEVASVKNKTAELINMLDEIIKKDSINPEQVRLVALAQTAYEEAAMWAVKALTI
jgi:hypothetical protein